ncbi:MAG: DsbA family protein [Nitrospinota bacterium]
MKIKKTSKITSLLLLFFVLPVLVQGAEKIPGKYKDLPGASRQVVKDSIEVVEFMSFYCGHCFAMFKNEPMLKGRYPHKLKFKYVPIQWGKAPTTPAEAFLIARDMGKGDEMRHAIFTAAFEQKKDIGSAVVLGELAKKIGLANEFNKRLASGEKRAEVENNMALTRKLRIEATPTVIMAGNIVVSPMQTGGKMIPMMQNLDMIISGLLKGKK